MKRCDDAEPESTGVSLPAESERMDLLVAPFPETLEARLYELYEARQNLLRELEPLAADLASPAAPQAGWSAAEIAHHLRLSEQSIARLLRKVLQAPERQTPADDSRLRAEWERIRQLVGRRDVPVQAPARVVPHDAPALAESLVLLQQSRQELLAAIEGVDYDDLRSISAPHPFEAVGVVTGAGWLSVVAYHELRHSQQINELGRQTAR